MPLTDPMVVGAAFTALDSAAASYKDAALSRGIVCLSGSHTIGKARVHDKAPCS